MQVSLKASAGHMLSHTGNFYTWNKPLLYKLQNYRKSFTLWWRTEDSNDRVQWSRRPSIKSWFKKLVAIFMVMWWIIYHSNWNHMLNKMVLSFFIGRRSCGHFSEELQSKTWKRRKTILSLWMLLTKTSFIPCFEVWHHQKRNFMVSKTVVSRFL